MVPSLQSTHRAFPSLPHTTNPLALLDPRRSDTHSIACCVHRPLSLWTGIYSCWSRVEKCRSFISSPRSCAHCSRAFLISSLISYILGQPGSRRLACSPRCDLSCIHTTGPLMAASWTLSSRRRQHLEHLQCAQAIHPRASRRTRRPHHPFPHPRFGRTKRTGWSARTRSHQTCIRR